MKTGVSPLARNLEQRFLPKFQAAIDDIASLVPQARLGVYSQPCGEATSTPGHVLGAYCNFPNAPLDQPDQVVLEIVVGDAWGNHPSIDADVIWCHPGHLEMELFSRPAPLSPQVLDQIAAALPNLLAAWRLAVQRGRPEL